MIRPPKFGLRIFAGERWTMTEIKTRDDVLEWFADSPRQRDVLLEKVVDGMLSKPDPFDGATDVTPARAWNWILDFGFCVPEARMGWVTREGKMLSANWGAHERLLYWLGLEAKDVERQGWARVGPFGYQCLFRLSPAQRRRIEKTGRTVDKEAERLKPIWTGSDADKASPSP